MLIDIPSTLVRVGAAIPALGGDVAVLEVGPPATEAHAQDVERDPAWGRCSTLTPYLPRPSARSGLARRLTLAILPRAHSARGEAPPPALPRPRTATAP